MEETILTQKKGNNQLYLCISLRDQLAFEQFCAHIHQSLFIHWLSNCTLKNPFIGVPFLRFNDNGKKATIHHHETFNERFPAQLISRNLDLANNEFIQFNTYTFDEKKHILIAFHHVLFDGKGAALVLKHLNGELPFTKENAAELLPKRLPWKNPIKQWINLVFVKKAIEATNKGETAYLPTKQTDKTHFDICTHEFNVEETRAIREQAKKNGSRFGINLLQAASVCIAVQNLIKKDNELWFPIPYNGRKRGAIGTLISNHTSFIFHRVKVSKQSTNASVIADLQEQMQTQLKSELPIKHNHLLQLMRFFPTKFNHYVTTKSSKGKIATFLYSSTELETESPASLISDKWILPPLSYLPGLTINFYVKNEQLHFNIVYATNKLNCNEVKQLKNDIIRQLIPHTVVI